MAACKAFSAMRKKNKSLDNLDVEVMTEGRKNYTWYHVTYETVSDDLLGTIQRPIARKIDQHVEYYGAMEAASMQSPCPE